MGGNDPLCLLYRAQQGGHKGNTAPLSRGFRGEKFPLYNILDNAPRFFFLNPILGGWTYLWFCAWVSHMVLGMMVFSPWYFVDLVKGTTVMF